MLKTLFRPSPAKTAGRALYAACASAARRPAFYTQAHAPDTPEGRFELYLIHVVLVLHRLRGEGAEAKAVSQSVFDAFVRSLDDGLREMGVGDLSVGKKMRRLGEAIYGRLKAYDEALAGPSQASQVQALVARTLFADRPDDGAAAVGAYVLASADSLSRQPLRVLNDGRVDFPAFGAEEIAA